MVLVEIMLCPHTVKVSFGNLILLVVVVLLRAWQFFCRSCATSSYDQKSTHFFDASTGFSNFADWLWLHLMVTAILCDITHN